MTSKQSTLHRLRDQALAARGFTLVELSVVIAVIAILAIIATSSFSAIQAKANYSLIDKDMKAMNLAIQKYYAKNGSYPVGTANVWSYRRRDGANFIPGLTPAYYTAGNLPDVTSGSQSSTTNNTYVYKSNGTDYKLIRLYQSTLPAVEANGVPSSMKDPTYPNDRWGYWSPGDSTY
jgi:prepilin-type N-terminal cleavage/methylation domain-containing protein